MKHICSALKRNGEGFTLVELIVVIAILAILAAVAYPVYTGYIDYTNKGLDRQTVGEIMNAMQLADYADPSLFGENGGAMVVLTADGVQVAGGLEGSDLKGALEDAFGDGSLSNTKLAYSDWNGTPDMSVFTGLKDSSTGISTYLSGDKVASFADNVGDLWDTFKTYTDGSIVEDSNSDYIGRMVAAFSGRTNTSGFQEMWKSGDFKTESGGSMAGSALAGIAARNYSFYSFAMSQGLSEEMLDELNAFKNNSQYFLTAKFEESTSQILKNSDWSTVFQNYKDNQSDTDALAFLGMIDAASKVGEGLDKTSATGEFVSNEDYIEAMSKYVDMVGNVLSKRVKFDDIASLATNVPGNAVVISATKANGVLNFGVTPSDANPRTENGSGSSTEGEGVDYTQSGATLNFGSGATTGEIIMSQNSSITVTITNLPGDNSAVQNYATTYSGNVTSATSNQAAQTVTITAGATGSGTVTITWNVSAGPVSINGILTINVTIK